MDLFGKKSKTAEPTQADAVANAVADGGGGPAQGPRALFLTAEHGDAPRGVVPSPWQEIDGSNTPPTTAGGGGGGGGGGGDEGPPLPQPQPRRHSHEELVAGVSIAGGRNDGLLVGA